MMNRAAREKCRRRAEAFVAEGEEHLRRQRAVVARLERDGSSSGLNANGRPAAEGQPASPLSVFNLSPAGFLPGVGGRETTAPQARRRSP